MRVLFLSPVVPWPLRSGGRIRTFELLRGLTQIEPRPQVHLHCVEDPPPGPEPSFEPGSLVHTFQGYARSTAPFSLRLNSPPPVRWFHSGSLRRFLNDEARWEDWDLVHLDELLLLPYLPEELPLPLVVHHHKLDLDLAEALGQKNSVCSRWRHLEQAACSRTQHHVVCGREDAQRLSARHEHLRPHVIPCGADTNAFRPEERQPVEGRLLFLGSLDYEPNLRALEGFLPRFQAARARDARLHLQIVGARPDARIRNLIGDGIELEPDVPDIRPFLRAAEALVAPLEVGGGSRVKICEALAAGCPVLASSCAAEGLELVPGEHLIVISDQSEWPNALVELVQAPDAARSMALEGRQRIRTRHHWPDLATRLAATWASCLQDPTENTPSP